MRSGGTSLTHIKAGVEDCVSPGSAIQRMRRAAAAYKSAETLVVYNAAGGHHYQPAFRPDLLIPISSCTGLKTLEVVLGGEMQIMDSDVGELASHLSNLLHLRLQGRSAR